VKKSFACFCVPLIGVQLPVGHFVHVSTPNRSIFQVVVYALSHLFSVLFSFF